MHTQVSDLQILNGFIRLLHANYLYTSIKIESFLFFEVKHGFNLETIR